MAAPVTASLRVQCEHSHGQPLRGRHPPTAPTVLTGNYSATATQVAPVTTTATGGVAGAGGGVGAAIALQAFSNHLTQATTFRNLQCLNCTFTATGSSSGV